MRVQARGSLARQQEDEYTATPTAVKLLQEDEIDDDDEEPNVPSSEGDVGADRTDLPSHEELLAGVASFQPPEGWQVEPAPKPEDWKPNNYAWVGKRIAHKFHRQRLVMSWHVQAVVQRLRQEVQGNAQSEVRRWIRRVPSTQCKHLWNGRTLGHSQGCAK